MVEGPKHSSKREDCGTRGDEASTADDAFAAEVESVLCSFTRACGQLANSGLKSLPGLELGDLRSFGRAENSLGLTEPNTFFEKAPSKPRLKPVADKQPVPCLDIEQFAPRAEQLFAGIDADADGCLSTSELAAAVQDHQFQGQDAQVVAALYHKREELKNLSDDHWFETGVTKADLTQVSSMLPKQLGNFRVARNSEEWLADDDRFKTADTNGNGFLSKDELTMALQQSDQKTRLPQFFSQLINRINTIQTASDDEFWTENDGITRKDLHAHATMICESNEIRLLGEVGGVLARTSESQLGGATYELFGGKKPADSIKPDAIKQGQLGDCSFLSGLASVVKSNPALIERMIKDNNDGTYTVTFPGAPGEPITIDAPTQVEAGLFNGVGENGTWALVIEKAFGKYCQQGASPRYPYLDQRGVGSTPVEGAGAGADLCSTLELLTGNRTVGYKMNSLRSHLRQELQDAFTSSPPRAVTAGTSTDPASAGKSGKTEDGFATIHAYSVIGFDPDGPGGGTVTIRNPWGHNVESTRGTIKITFDQFRKNFTDMAVEARK